MDSWLVVYCKVREERRAQQNLANLGFETYVPVLERKVTKAGKSRTGIELMFPRYLFLRVTSTDKLASVRHTRGVNDFVRFGGRIASVADDLVLKIMHQQICMQQNVTQQQIFKRGEAVVVVGGPFAGLDAIYQAPNGDARSIILLSLLQQQSHLVVDSELLARKL